MNDVTDRALGTGVKGYAAALVLSILALLAQLGHAFWQATVGAKTDENQTLNTAHILHRLPADARDLALLARAELDGTYAREAFRNHRSQMAAQARQLMVQTASDQTLQAQTQALVSAWAEMEAAAGRWYDNLDAVQEMAVREQRWFDQVEGVKDGLDDLVREMVVSGAAASQVYLALHQWVLLDDMSGRVARIRNGDERAALDAVELPQEVAAFTRVLTGLQRGDAGIALHRLQGRRTRTALAQVASQWEPLRALLEDIAQHAPARVLAHSAALALEQGADRMLRLAGELGQVAAAPPPPTFPGMLRRWLALGTGTLVVLTGTGLWLVLRRRRRHWDELAAQRHHREQDTFARLLDEMGALAEGDLTVKATFSEGAAGALADSINFVTRQLGARIQAMTAAADPITTSAGQAHRLAVQLAEVSQYQREELDAALAKVQQLSTCLGAFATQMAAVDEADQRVAAHECLCACADLTAMLETLHTVTARLAGEAGQAVVAMDALAHSAAALRESADGFVLPQ